MVQADGPPLIILIEDVVLWPFRLARLAAKVLKLKVGRNTLGAKTSYSWVPRTEVERTVYAALILAGEPINNLRLAALMGVSAGVASRRVTQLDGLVSKARKGRGAAAKWVELVMTAVRLLVAQIDSSGGRYLNVPPL
jgi:hypothetical protein